MLLAADWKGNAGLKILCGGEPWPMELARELRGKCGSLWNMYGPTETTIWSAACQVGDGEKMVIGKPIANTRFYILDANLQPVPIGTPGELFIGGDGLARGYLNRPELTAEKFIADPFSTKQHARLYRTGDLARYHADGQIEFLGRIDNQVKIRGFRIELGEIEAALASHSNVREAIVTAREDNPGDKRLVAYLTAKNGEMPKASELRSLLHAKLPDYMLPSAFVTLEKLPLTASGKVDRKALPAPDAEQDRPDSSAFVAPRTPTEKALAGILCEILGMKRVGVEDDFFRLGGHSLLALQFQMRIEKRLGSRIELSWLFTEPTIRSLASAIERSQSTGPVQNAWAGTDGTPGASIEIRRRNGDLGEEVRTSASEEYGPEFADDLTDDTAMTDLAASRTNVGRFLATSDHPVATLARRTHRLLRRFSIPTPRFVFAPILCAFLGIRSVYFFFKRVFVCEPLFKTYCERYGKNVHTGNYVHWIQGKGAIILGDNVTVDGKCGFQFATRFSDRPTFTVGNNSGIGHNCLFTIGKAITIGSHCRIASGTIMFDSSGHPADAVARAQRAAPHADHVRPIVIQDHVWIGRNCIVMPGVTIGEGAIIAAGAVVLNNVAPYTVISAQPAVQIGATRSPGWSK
jgi:acetyltransferase-like isoleucine patch superfamily enzyme/acyl carrier protein